MNDIRRVILLEMLNEIEALAFPEEVERFAMGAKTAIQTFENSWEKFKKFGSDIEKLMEAAKNFTFEDIKTLLEKDPASLACLGLDTLSLVDPTGLSDIIQGFILINQGVSESDGWNVGFGILSLALGLGQGYLLLQTGGTATPLVSAIKQGYKGSIKNLSKEGFEAIIKSLVSSSSKILDFLKQSNFGRKFINVVSSFIEKARNFKMSNFNSIDEAIQYLTGFSPKNLNFALSPASKKKITEGVLLFTQAKFYQAGVGGAHAKAMQEKLPEIAELYMRKVYCKRNKDLEEWCSKITTNPKDFSVSSSDDSHEEYYLARKNLDPQKIIKWYEDVGSKTSL